MQQLSEGFEPDFSLENEVFNYETTTRTDYRNGFTSKLDSTKTAYKPKGTCYRIRPRPLKDTHSLTDWKKPNVPFDLFWKTVDVDRCDPSDVQKPYFKPIDHKKLHVIKTRPPVNLTPAGFIDELDEPARTVLVKSIYTTNTMDQMSLAAEHASKNLHVIAPLPLRYSPTNPLTLRHVHAPYVSPEWRMDSVSWDNRSLRTHANPTEEFWLRRAKAREDAAKSQASDQLQGAALPSDENKT